MSQTSQPPLYNASKLPPSSLQRVSRFSPENGYFTKKQLVSQQQQQLEQAALLDRVATRQEEQGKATEKQPSKSQGNSQGTLPASLGGPQVPVVLKAPKLPGTGPVPRTSLGMLPQPKTAADWNLGTRLGEFNDKTFLRPFNSLTGMSSFTDNNPQGGLGQTYGHYIDKFLNPASSAWQEPTTDKTEEALKWGSRASTAVGATAGLGAIGLAAIPALGAGATTAAPIVAGGAARSAAPTVARGVIPTVRQMAGKAYKLFDNASRADYMSEMVTGKGITDWMGMGGGSGQVGTQVSAAPTSNLRDIPTYGAEKYRGTYDPDNWSNAPSHGFKMPKLRKVGQSKDAKFEAGKFVGSVFSKGRDWLSGAGKSAVPTASAVGGRGWWDKTKDAGQTAFGLAGTAMTADYGSQMLTGRGITDWLGFGNNQGSQAEESTQQEQPQGMWNVPSYGAEPTYSRYNPATWTDPLDDEYVTPNMKMASLKMDYVPVSAAAARSAISDQQKEAASRRSVERIQGWIQGLIQRGRAQFRGASDAVYGPGSRPTRSSRSSASTADRGGNATNQSAPSPAAARSQNSAASEVAGNWNSQRPVSPTAARTLNPAASEVAGNWNRPRTASPGPPSSPVRPIGESIGGGNWGSVDLGRAAERIGLLGAGALGVNALSRAMAPDTGGMSITNEYGRQVSPDYYTKSIGNWYDPWSWGRSQAMKERDAVSLARQTGAFDNVNQAAGGNRGNGGGGNGLPSSLYSRLEWPTYSPPADYYRSRVLANQGTQQ